MYIRWVEQIIDFIEQVILVEEEEKGHRNKIDDKEIKTTTSKRKVHLVGNSVGGHIAAHIARRRPDLISSICLLNPTPVRFFVIILVIFSITAAFYGSIFYLF